VGLEARLTHAYMPSRETLVAACSRSNSEALAARVMLTHPRTTFHPCMCGLCRGAAAVAAALIGYDDVKVVAGMTTRRKVNDYFLYTDTRLCWIAALTLLPLFSTSSGNDP
jgi:hypothetical protein